MFSVYQTGGNFPNASSTIHQTTRIYKHPWLFPRWYHMFLLVISGGWVDVGRADSLVCSLIVISGWCLGHDIKNVDVLLWKSPRFKITYGHKPMPNPSSTRQYYVVRWIRNDRSPPRISFWCEVPSSSRFMVCPTIEVSLPSIREPSGQAEAILFVFNTKARRDGRSRFRFYSRRCPTEFTDRPTPGKISTRNRRNPRTDCWAVGGPIIVGNSAKLTYLASLSALTTRHV